MHKGFVLNDADLKFWPWAKSHACVPTTLEMDDFYRIYFAPRNENGQSIPVYVDVSKDNLQIINYGHQIISLGKVGTFDDGGIMPCSVVKFQDKIYLYYVGWNPSVSVPYRNSIGVCVSENGGKDFYRIFDGPIVDRNRYEPYFTASPFVLYRDNKFFMWYASSTGFIKINQKNEPLYHIKYAESTDGFNWERNNISSIIPKHESECIARPSVLYENGIYKMWYCYRGSYDYRDGVDSYKIGYGESTDGIKFDRKDNLIDIQKSELDDKMMCYPNVLKNKNKKIMFYNGNGFGLNGICYLKF